MQSITQGKTNWKYILIVLILAVIVGVIAWQYLLKPQPCSYLIEPTENETKKFLGDESKWGDIKIELKDIQGLFGGRNISISRKGEATVEVPRFGPEGLDTKTYNLLLNESEIKEIINIFIKNDFVTITTEDRPPLHFAKLEIILTNAEEKQHKIAVWDDDLREIGVWDDDLQENERFMNIYQELLSIGRKAETADWETYRNEEYGFKIKYPSEWYLKEYLDCDLFEPDCSGVIKIQNMENVSGRTGYLSGNSVFMMKISADCSSSIEEWVTKISRGYGENSREKQKNKMLKEIKTIKIGGEENKVWGSKGITQETMYFLRNGRGYLINYFSDSVSLFNQDKETFNKILSTFKFIK